MSAGRRACGPVLWGAERQIAANQRGRGRGKITVGGQDYEARPAGIIVVMAAAAHKFHSIEQDLKLLVFFSSTKAWPASGRLSRWTAPWRLRL